MQRNDLFPNVHALIPGTCDYVTQQWDLTEAIKVKDLLLERLFCIIWVVVYLITWVLENRNLLFAAVRERNVIKEEESQGRNIVGFEPEGRELPAKEWAWPSEAGNDKETFSLDPPEKNSTLLILWCYANKTHVWLPTCNSVG